MTEQQTRIARQALAETRRYIAKESARNPALRPVAVQKLLAQYIAHEAKLLAMLGE